MKRGLIPILFFCLLLSGCAAGRTGKTVLFDDPTRDFSFAFPSGMSAVAKDDAITVYIEEYDKAPYVSLCFTPLGDEALDVSAYLDGLTASLRDSYGDSLIELSETSSYETAGKSLSGIRCVLGKQTDGAYKWYLIDANDTYAVLYACAYEKGDEAKVENTLACIVETLRPTAGSVDSDTQADGSNPQAVQTMPVDRSKLGDYTITKNTPLQLQTALYNGGFFSLQLPIGWAIETTGEYVTFGFRAYDPQNPARQIFFYMKHEPLRKSYEAQKIYQDSANMVGPNDIYGYQISADAPVLTQPTTPAFFSIYNSYNDYINKYGINHQLPCLQDIRILDSFPNSTPSVFNTLDNSIVRAIFKSANGVECEGLLAAQVTDKLSITDVYPGVDMGFYAVYNCNGVIAPANEFDELREQLCACLASFDFTEEYVRAAQQHIIDETDAITSMAASMQAAYDSYNSAWSARQTSYDIISQKNSDATLGYDRLYDPSTGEVYRAELGFYDSYNTNRDQYSNSNLRLIDESTESYYLNGIDYYIGKY